MQSARELAGHRGDARVRSALERALLSDREARVRQTAAEALAGFGDAKALPALKRAQARDSVRDVRQAAYKAIIMIEGY
jgi:HEAT repeat protein